MNFADFVIFDLFCNCTPNVVVGDGITINLPKILCQNLINICKVKDDQPPQPIHSLPYFISDQTLRTYSTKWVIQEFGRYDSDSVK